MRSPVNHHRLWQVAVDAGLVAGAWVLSWYVRFEGDTRPVYYDRYLDVPDGSLPETERAAAENLALPMWAGISPEQQERVVETVRSAVGVPA